MSAPLVIGLVSVSDRASAGVYKDEGIPALKSWLASAIAAPAWRDETRLIADEQPIIERTLIRNARKEQKEGRAPRAFRELFRALKAIETAKPLSG